MKFTDGFFGFPIKIHEKLDGGRNSTRWVGGIARIPGEWFIEDKVCWHEDMDENKTIDDFEDKGLDELTVVVDSQSCHFQCLWDRKKFEEKLNEFMDRMYSKMDEKEGTEEKEVK